MMLPHLKASLVIIFIKSQSYMFLISEFLLRENCLSTEAKFRKVGPILQTAMTCIALLDSTGYHEGHFIISSIQKGLFLEFLEFFLEAGLVNNLSMK